MSETKTETKSVQSSTKSEILKRCDEKLKNCKGNEKNAYVQMTVKELMEISDEKPELANHATVFKSVRDIKELCK